MTDSDVPEELIAQLQQDEGLRLTAYQDVFGHWTIGYGHTPSRPGMIWTHDQALAMLRADCAAALRDVDRVLPWARRLGPVRHAVFVNMAFNMGIGRLNGFHRALAAARRGDHEACARHMQDSLWAQQVGDRARRLARQMRTNEWVLAHPLPRP